MPVPQPITIAGINENVRFKGATLRGWLAKLDRIADRGKPDGIFTQDNFRFFKKMNIHYLRRHYPDAVYLRGYRRFADFKSFVVNRCIMVFSPQVPAWFKASSEAHRAARRPIPMFPVPEAFSRLFEPPKLPEPLEPPKPEKIAKGDGAKRLPGYVEYLESGVRRTWSMVVRDVVMSSFRVSEPRRKSVACGNAEGCSLRDPRPLLPRTEWSWRF